MGGTHAGAGYSAWTGGPRVSDVWVIVWEVDNPTRASGCLCGQGLLSVIRGPLNAVWAARCAMQCGTDQQTP
eukprot:240384-Chlamydomonas_euryale.AAC.1